MKGKSYKFVLILILIIIVVVGINAKLDDKNNTLNQNNKLTENAKQQKIVSNDIRIGIIEFDNLNPILSNNKNVQDISRLIFDSLFNITTDYKLEPSLATECSKLEDGTYLIKLRENIKWQDGNSFDADDVIFTIDMLKNKENNSVYYYNVKNISAIEKIDEYTVKITLNKEIPYFEYNLIFPIVSSKYFDEYNFSSETKNVRPVGTGRFYISNVENSSILLKKNVNGWNAQNMQLDTITLNLYDSLSSTITAFREGNIDIFTTSNIDIEDYLKNNTYNKAEYVNRNYDYLALNCNNNVLENVEVRQAINSAINKDDIIKSIYNDKYKKSNYPLDFGSYVYNNNNTSIGYDKNTAKRLLVDAGWKYSNKKWSKTVNNKYLKIELYLVVNKKNTTKVKVAKKIKEQLESVGMQINLIEATTKQYNSYLKNKNYDIIMVSGTYGYSPSVNKYFGKSNLAKYSNKEANQILSEIENINDENELKEKNTKLVDIYNNDVPFVSLYFDSNTLIYSPSLKGNVSPNSYNLFYGIENWYREYTEKNK